MTITTPIIPHYQQLIGQPEALNLEAICVFMATGFFLGADSYYKDQYVLQPGYHYDLDSENQLILSETSYFKWHYTPKERSFETVVREFGDLFEQIIQEQTLNKHVILPLSGGLDSRTQAVALSRLNVSTHAYSYAFTGGHDETRYAKKIAAICEFPFQAMQVPAGYLWKSIEQLAQINACYSEFTHPRQMAFIEEYKSFGDVFCLGHWGDVLFDDMGVPDNLSLEGQVAVLYKKVVKKQGLILAERLWQTWGLSGDFKTYLNQRLYNLLQAIDIPESANAQVRAFKSMYWAPRWTSVNLSVFESVKPISLPYYDNRMCEFICSVPERYLANRQIQIAYIKLRMPELAKVNWEAQRPFNLYSYKHNKIPWNLPYRVFNKLERSLKTKPFIQRNWELQFLGSENDRHLKAWLFENQALLELVPKSLVLQVYEDFKNSDGIHESHAVSMLLTLSLFAKQAKL
tara:strand:+ start:20188 stop:21567 length:1380 start_codon:yes stop_codon:yes gene_type:complete